MENVMWFKVLEQGRSIHGGNAQWALPVQQEDGSYLPGAWMPDVEGEIAVCKRGYHLTTNPWGAWMEWDAVVYEAEGDSDSDSDTSGDKTAFRRARLLRPAPVPDWWTDAHTFVDGLKDVKWGQPDGKPDPTWRLFTGPTLAAARDAAWAAARDAAWAAARAAARAAAWAAARAAAWYAALYTVTQIICRDLDIAPDHRAYVEARWNAVRKGYFVFCDVDGVLYVYSQEHKEL